ncbi:Hematopoietic prostaglandin D synthase [Gracilariopsis chorda]|uniref:Hematopoietic prostaglandin D synthase n=1 Tax=Gracilariopsis chorda TaxID=448386 RepID=A0A2V3IEF1_9FLOR|nr:Hematopoietic prostaglandin D synthase [Gracilariopsis chorda]|eukprot:PXF40465.1 Hematopoietic prostaglandin D synthase [Gracilariopsis chorda]
MPSLKLTYFDLRGRAEPIRLAFLLSDIEYEDDRFSFPQWKEVKPKTPYGSVPTLTVDGEQMAQSGAILRYVGKLAALYPSDAIAALKVDEVMETLVDLNNSTYSYRGSDTEQLKAARKKLVDEDIPRYVGALEKRLETFGGASHAVGNELTVADLVITCTVNSVQCGILDYVPVDVLDQYPRINAIHKAVMDNPKVVEWYKKYPIKKQTPKMD